MKNPTIIKINKSNIDYSSDIYDRFEDDLRYIERKINAPAILTYTEYGDTIKYNYKNKTWTLKYASNKNDIIKGKGIKALSQYTFATINELKLMLDKAFETGCREVEYVGE